MPKLVFLSCELCDRKVRVSEEATRSPEKLEMELPEGWVLYWQRDGITWKYIWAIRCPDHPPTTYRRAGDPMP